MVAQPLKASIAVKAAGISKRFTDDFISFLWHEKRNFSLINEKVISKNEIFAPNLLSISYYRSTFPKKDFFEYNIVANDDLLIANIVDTMKKANNTVVHKAEIHVDNSVNIGDGNNIIGSTIGQNNSAESITDKSNEESLFSKISWKIVVPIIVTVVAAAICAWFGLK